jgi:PhnB protein
MTTVNIYLNFDGTCEEAFNFYKSAFREEFRKMQKFKDASREEGFTIPKEREDKIMHVSLPVSKETVLMGSDTDGEWFGHGFKEGNNFSISIYTDREEEADRLFQQLSNGGEVKLPMQHTFWGEYFGMFTDKFGINWMISHKDEE